MKKKPGKRIKAVTTMRGAALDEWQIIVSSFGFVIVAARQLTQNFAESNRSFLKIS